MFGILYYMQRWVDTQYMYFVKNIAMLLVIFSLACTVVRDGVQSESCLFTLLMCCIWSGTFNSISLFYSEENYVVDDLNKFLSVKVYIISNFVMQLVLCALESLFCTAILKLFYEYGADGLVFDRADTEYYVTFFMILISSDMVAFSVGMLVKNINTAMSVIPAILIVQFLFSGCLFELDSHFEKIACFTSAKWGFSALGTISGVRRFMHEPQQLIKCWTTMGGITVLFFLISGLFLYMRLNYGRRD